MFSTTRGTVRRNKLSDFVQVNRNGKIAMKLDDERDEILNVETCSENDDVLLTTALGQCIRFPVTDVRVFAGRNSIGVRGISLAEGDRVISMAILTHVDATASERLQYIKWSRADDGELAGEDAIEASDDTEQLSDERAHALQEKEQFVLTLSEKGFGKRSSSYDFRTSGRGGKGIRATDTAKVDEIGPLVAAFPVENEDQIMLVSNGGQLIRVPVDQIRIASRATKGVTIFSTSEDEKVVSVERINEPEAENGDAVENGEPLDDDAPDAPRTE
jgi:DNA gyrase subunit A